MGLRAAVFVVRSTKGVRGSEQGSAADRRVHPRGHVRVGSGNVREAYCACTAVAARLADGSVALARRLAWMEEQSR